jgi:hypothetical protein
MTDERHQERRTTQDDAQPAIHQPERDDAAPLGPKDSDRGPDADYPDPDEYAGANDR